MCLSAQVAGDDGFEKTYVALSTFAAFGLRGPVFESGARARGCWERWAIVRASCVGGHRWCRGMPPVYGYAPRARVSLGCDYV